MNSYTTIISSLFITAMLNGCGIEKMTEKNGENTGWEGDGSSSIPEPTYYAQDTVRHSNVSANTYIDLEKNIDSSDGSQVYITNVESLDGQAGCDIISIEKTGFSVKTEAVQSCYYKYSVGGATSHRQTSKTMEASASVSVLIGSDVDTFTPIGAVTSINTNVVVDIAKELSLYGETIPEGYSLDSHVLIPNDSSSGSVALASGNNIEYQPGFDFIGVERVLYSFSNGDSVIHGDLDISTSSLNNTAPTASYVHYSLEGGAPIPWGEEVFIDVKDYIHDMDGDELQLVDVYGYDSTLNIPTDYNGNNNHYDDTVFGFYSEKPGKHSITYVVSDKKGGYAHGMIQLNVENVYKSLLKTSDDGQEMYFTPPYTNEQADVAHVQHIEGELGDGIHSVNGVGTAKTTFDVATSICSAKQGRVPTVSEAILLRERSLNQSIFDEGRWPENEKYWVYDVPNELSNAQYAVIDMATGTVSEAQAREYYYSFCIESQPLSIFIEGAHSIPVYSHLDPISRMYQSYATFPQNDEAIAFDNDLEWTFVIDTPDVASFDYRTRVLTSSPQNPEVGATAHITACTKSNLCGTKTVQLYTQLFQMPSNTSGLTVDKSCEDMGYKSINEDVYREVFNSMYKPDTSSWLYENDAAYWSSGLVVDIYGRIQPQTEYTRRVAEIQENSAVKPVNGEVWTIIDTSYGPSHLICQY
ncbi:hypothetical protein [Vibrio sp. TRT 29B02]|uniref:hypothetical protein n=1 Tax=Vibrio sp. TRT 29B02 TaxID=3418508 RepID=UPI003CF7DB31